ncbi:MAG: hypothetical protein ACNA7M_07715 [Roseovarius sp.]
MVAGGESGWAILTASDGDRLIDGETVVEIAPDGVWIERAAERVLIAFEETPDEMMARMMVNGVVPEDEAEIPASALSGSDPRRVLGRAGSVRMVSVGSNAAEIFPEIKYVIKILNRGHEDFAPADDGTFPRVPDSSFPFDGVNLNQPFDAGFIDRAAQTRRFPRLPSALRFADR